mgnify:CR=1 FL=1
MPHDGAPDILGPEVLVIESLPAAAQAELEGRHVTHRFTSIEALHPVAEGIRAVVTGGGTGLDPAIMAALPGLRLIAVNGVGTDRIDLGEAERRGIAVSTTRGLLDADVADLAMGLMLDVMRGISANDRFVRAGNWLKGAPPLGDAITGRKLGIVGLGAIGEAIARRGAAFGMQIAYHTRREKPDSSYTYYSDIVTLARWCDVLVLALPGGAATNGLVNRTVIDAIGPQGYLVNVARGSVVDEPELVDALENGRLAGAGLDVFAHEPQVPEALLGLENVVLQAHRGSATKEVRAAMAAHVLTALDGLVGT